MTVQPTEQCPNCGKWFPRGSCKHSYTGRISTENGSYASTLYGVCKQCADMHKEYYEAMNAAATAREAQQ